jgi:hypothetical protein
LRVSLRWDQGAPLAGLAGAGPGFAAWLSPDAHGGAAEATQALQAVLQASAHRSGAPLFSGAEGAAWRASGDAVTAGLAAAGSGAGIPADLAAGRLDVIVTGQQPGFLGGPLLTLHKIATAIALAARRTAAGRPTVPVFWCGDDDDDLIEALAPVAWDPVASALVRADGRAAARSGRLDRVMIGATPARRWCAPGGALLQRLAAAPDAGPLAADLAALWVAALADNWEWSRLNLAAVGRVFVGRGLIVVRGGDPLLHAAAAPLYAEIAGRRAHCRELTRSEGLRLEALGVPPAISERSLRHHLFAAVDGRRVTVPEAATLPASADLRPGVMLRSLVQDWLLRPAAVVVGPGEAAYLRQLEPLYQELGVARAPLVPRLFAWVLPREFPLPLLASFAKGSAMDASAAEALAARLAATTARDLAGVLASELALPADRAAALAHGRARRWQRGVKAMLRQEARRQWERQTADAPGWVLPEGRRQERRLAAFAAAALFGDELTEALIGAASDHLDDGARGRWHEYLVR